MTVEGCDVFIDEFTCVAPQTRVDAEHPVRTYGWWRSEQQHYLLSAFNEPKDAPAAITRGIGINRFWHGKWMEDDACFDAVVGMEDSGLHHGFHH